VYAGVTLFRGVRNRAFAHAVTGFAGVCLIGPDYLPFAVGVGLAERRLAADPPARGGALLGWLLVLAACWCGGVHPTPHRDWWLPFAALLPPPLAFDTAVKVLYTLGAGLLLNAALTFPPLTAALRTRASQFLGYVSYPVYAVHQPLLYSVAAAVCVGCLPAVGYTAAAVLGVAAAAVASVGLAWAVARYVDAPFNRWVKKAVTRAMNQRWGPPAAGDRAGGADVAATTPPPAARAEPPAVSAGGR
jgi:peptidoglycan/LPS O-acetylase OafA/YrhL